MGCWMCTGERGPGETGRERGGDATAGGWGPGHEPRVVTYQKMFLQPDGGRG